MIDFGLFRSRAVWMSNLANALISVTSLSIWLVWPLYLKRVWEYSDLEVGLALTLGPVSAGTMTLVGGRIAERIGHRLPIQIGSMIMVISVSWFRLVLDENGSYITSFLPGIVVFGIGWGLSQPTMNSYALAAVPDADWGSMNATFNMFRNVGGAIGIAAVVAFVGSSKRIDVVAAFDRTWMFLLCVTLIGSALTIVLWPRDTDRGEGGSAGA